MRAPFVIIVAALALAGCKKQPAPGASTSTKDADALWALAPDSVAVGVVITPRALRLAEGAFTSIRSMLKTAPELAFLSAQLDGAMAAVGGDLSKLADVGLDHDKGAAFFAGTSEGAAILPVTDRDKFLARVGGTRGPKVDTIGKAICKDTAHGYTCASSEAMFDRIGKGTPALRTTLELVKARGDVELVVTGALPIGSLEGLAGVMQLDRGAVVIRAAVKGVPTTVTSKLINARPRADTEHTSAFASANLSPLLTGAPPAPLPGGITLADLVKTIGGPFTVTIAAGEQIADARLPLNDPAPATTLIEHCSDLAPLGILADQQTPGSCRIKVPQLGQELEIWIAGKELRVGAKTPAPGKAVPMTPVGAEIARGEWAFAAWGRGTMFSAAAQPLPGLTEMPNEAAMIVRGVSMLDELGTAVKLDGDVLRILVNVRTIWANPDEVVAKLLAISPTEVGQGRAGDASKAIAAAAPGTPFAADFEAGQSGMMIPTAVVGMLAAVAIPAFMDYMKHSKMTGASLQLRRIEKLTKAYYLENGKYPVGEATLTPPESCCDAPTHKCTGDWSQPTWKLLGFAIDQPSLFQYSYTSDGQTFTANAVGDLDCDGTPVIYVARGTIVNGAPSVTIVTPPPNTD